MGNVTADYRLGVGDIQIFGPNPDIPTIPEDEFFALQKSGQDTKGCLPLPASVQMWNDGSYKGQKILVGRSNEHLYMLLESSNFGFALFHYVYDGEDGSSARFNDYLAYRIIQTERSLKTMPATTNLQQLALNGGAGAAASYAAPAVSYSGNPAVDSDDGIQSNPNLKRIQNEALAGGYVAGYIMATAPSITLSLSKHSSKNSDVTYKIIAKESKPSNCLAVLMAIPSRCCRRGNTIATAEEVKAGNVDLSNGADDLVNMVVDVHTAIAYIYAYGGRLAEYAPNVTDMDSQWSRDAIIGDYEGVSYVEVRATQARRTKKSKNQDPFRFSLRTTSRRNSLYTQNNVVCLRALEHVKIPDEPTEEEAYRLNESAFGSWRRPKKDSETALERAYHSCPDKIWRKTYTINGEEVEGIGSAFFMSAKSETNEGGTPIMKCDLEYYPWYLTGNLRQDNSQKPVTSIVSRHSEMSKNGNSPRMVAKSILYKENPDHKVFAPYRGFVKFITEQGFLTQEKLMTMGRGSTRSRRRKSSITDLADRALLNYLKNERVISGTREMQNAIAAQDTLNRRFY